MALADLLEPYVDFIGDFMGRQIDLRWRFGGCLYAEDIEVYVLKFNEEIYEKLQMGFIE
jgi:hypothetical protein